jgi:hypothetical protein
MIGVVKMKLYKNRRVKNRKKYVGPFRQLWRALYNSFYVNIRFSAADEKMGGK